MEVTVNFFFILVLCSVTETVRVTVGSKCFSRGQRVAESVDDTSCASVMLGVDGCAAGVVAEGPMEGTYLLEMNILTSQSCSYYMVRGVSSCVSVFASLQAR
jgi:hypothetical protein